MQDDDINARLLMLLMIADWMLVFLSIVLRISPQFIPDPVCDKNSCFLVSLQMVQTQANFACEHPTRIVNILPMI